MVDQPDWQPARLDPLAPPEARAAYVRELKAMVEAGDYFVSVDDIARAILAELSTNYHYE
ncbi:MAG: flagellar biosynthesis anti-sigma factor FlgM [Acidimicrobiia bacterium]